MSVRSDKTETAAAMANLQIAPSATATGGSAADHVSATIAAAQQADSALAEHNSLSVSNPEHPIRRSISVNIRSTLGDLCLRKAKGQWQPTQTALKNMFQVCVRHTKAMLLLHTNTVLRSTVDFMYVLFFLSAEEEVHLARRLGRGHG